MNLNKMEINKNNKLKPVLSFFHGRKATHINWKAGLKDYT